MDEMNNISKPKVLMVAMFPPPFSSGERMLNLTIKEMLSGEFDAEIINVSTGKLNPKTAGLEKVANQLKSFILYFKAYVGISKKLRNSHYKAFYFVTPSSSFGHLRDWVMLKLIKGRIENVYAFIQNGNYDTIFRKRWHKSFTSSFVERISKFVFVSEGLKNRVTHYVPDDKCAVIRNSIQPAVTFTEDEIQRKIGLGLQKAPLKIVYISNMNPTKGYMDLAKAVSIVSAGKGGLLLEVHFIGEWLWDEQLAEFKQFVNTNNLSDVIVIHGKVNDRGKIKQFLYDSAIFVLPTYFPQEAQPVSIIEALNAGTPVIATAHASIPEYITNDYNGILVDKQSPEQIAAAILKLADEETWLRIAKAARKSFNESFSLDVYKQQIFSLFDGAK